MAVRHRSKTTGLLLLLCTALVFVCLVLLGNWQMRRLEWKTDLINIVESRAFGAPVAAPGANEWGEINAQDHAYLRVEANGVLQHDKEIPVTAVTEFGSGYWIMTPLLRDNGETIWINRGFVPFELKDPATRSETSDALVSVTGLLRISEPKGTFLQSNDPKGGRWYSRDIAAFSDEKELERAAPFFIDAEEGGGAESWPRGGLTRVDFRNAHLVYALTWYTMAILLAGGVLYILRTSGRWSGDATD